MGLFHPHQFSGKLTSRLLAVVALAAVVGCNPPPRVEESKAVADEAATPAEGEKAAEATPAATTTDTRPPIRALPRRSIS